MFNIHNSAKTKRNMTMDCSRLKCYSTRISQTQSSCPRVTEEDRLIFENMQIKYQLKQLEDEFKMFRLQQKQLKFGQVVENPTSRHHSLEVYSKQLEVELLNKMKETEELKRNVNQTRYQELMIESKEYQIETLRLKKQINQLNSLLNLKVNGVNFKDLYEDLQQRLKRLHHENKLSHSMIHQLQLENSKLKNQIEKLELDNRHLENENRKQQQLIGCAQLPASNKFKNRLQMYREEIEQAKLSQKITELQQQLVTQQNYKEQYIQQLLKKIDEKEDQLKAYEIANPNEIIRQATQTQQDILDSKYYDCIQNIQTEQSITDDIILEMPSLLNLSRQQSIRKKGHLLEYQKSFQIDMSSINGFEDGMQEESDEGNESDEENDEKTLRLPKVNFADVENIGKKLRFDFLLKKIPWTYINQVFGNYEGELTIQETKEILQKDPFLMQNDEETILTARYLIEDNSQDYVIYSQKQSNTVPVIKSVFRQLLGRYELYTQTEKENLEQGIRQFFQKYFQYSSAGDCENSDCDATMKLYSDSLQPRQLEYLLMINYSFKKDLKLQWKELLEYFCKQI